MLQEKFSDIILLIQQVRHNAIQTVNTELINLYWLVGEHISKRLASTSWGEKTIYELAHYLNSQYPELKGFNRRGLYRMKQFFETYTSSTIVSSVMTQLENPHSQPNAFASSAMAHLESRGIKNTVLTQVSWTHHLVLLARTKTEEEREYYLRLCIQEKYSVRELERQINSGVFERVMIGNQNQPPALKEIKQNISNIFKDSYIFEFLNIPEPHSEGALQKALITQMKNFILELGRDFLFVSKEYRLQVGNSDFFIDLLFYHRGLQCLIAFELKADKFKPEHLGQLNFYLEALDRDVKKANENPSIGILLCKDKDSEVVEYALSRNLSPALVAEYRTQLPDKEVLQRKLHLLFENRVEE